MFRSALNSPMTQPVLIPWQPYPDMTDVERADAARAFHAAMATRRTCRAFAPTPVAREVIEAAILAAGSAPSGANHQPWHFAVVGSAAAKRAIREGAEAEEREFYAGKAGQEWLEALAPLGTDADKSYLEVAPWLIVVFGQRRGGPQPGDDRQNYYVTESVGIACGLLLAALHQAGLATLTHTPNPMRFLNTICARPANEKPLMIVTVGHAAADATIPLHAIQRKSIEEITSWL
ncbi:MULTISPECIES: nitroreductase family protein [unclassified Sphingomonas]|jgi:nitroreductase|uniref:nitroreductase family protein n=2 Tax=unclassified Sphingomonas TaxID=196159 RepID=UPI000AF5FBAC|nr:MULTISPECIES: nitroreductase family protein [unclassified Sphingomonas]